VNAEQRRAASLRPVRPGAVAVRPWPFHDTDASWAVISNIPLEGMDSVYEGEPRVWPVYNRTSALWMATQLMRTPRNRLLLLAEAHQAAGTPAGTYSWDPVHGLVVHGPVPGPADVQVLHNQATSTPWPCCCGEMLQDSRIRCPRHPAVRVRTPAEKAAFARDWDRRVEEGLR